jgi:hypothetical protein
MTYLKRSFVFLLGAATLCVGFVPSSEAQTQQSCTSALINGRYGFLISGFHLGIGQYGLLGTVEADGEGHIHGGGLQSVNGDQSETSFTGTYQVKPDCTGVTEVTFATNLPDQIRFVIVDEGNEILLMDNGGHTVEMGEAKRQFRVPRSPHKD